MIGGWEGREARTASATDCTVTSGAAGADAKRSGGVLGTPEKDEWRPLVTLVIDERCGPAVGQRRRGPTPAPCRSQASRGSTVGVFSVEQDISKCPSLRSV